MVYRYWCEPATPADAAILRGQIRLAAEYRRELALIENRARVLWRARQAEVGAGAMTDAVRAEIRDFRRDPARKSALVDALRPVVTDGDAEEDDPGDLGHGDDSVDSTDPVGVDLVGVDSDDPVARIVALGLSRDAALALVVEDAVAGAHGVAKRAARADATGRGLYWGTYHHAEEGASASFRSTPVHDDVATWHPQGVGCVAVHVQPARPLTPDDDWVRIGPIVRHGSEIDRSGRVRPARHREVKIRVGTDAGRTPRWAVLHVLMHREVPDGAVVSWAVVKLRQVGSKSRWTLCVTVGGVPASGRSTRGIPDVAARAARGAGVDIGWRRVPGGVRVAYWWGSDGRSGEVVVPDRVLGADDEADRLRAIRDRNKNEIREVIQAWVRGIPVLTEQEVAERNHAVELDLIRRCEDFIDEHDLLRHGATIRREETTLAQSVLVGAGNAAGVAIAAGAMVTAVRYRAPRIRGDGGIGYEFDAFAPVVTAGPWIIQETKSIHQWLRTSRFVRLIARWRVDRVPGDDEVFARVVAWLKQDRHLWDWEAAVRERRQRRVNEQIRLLAVRLAREYGRIGVEAPMVARLIRRPSRDACRACAGTATRCDQCLREERTRRIAATRVARAAPARTREEIERFGRAYGATVVRVNPAYTTMDCAHCGHRREDVADWAALEIRCPACGVTEDQDLTAAKNLCRAARDAGGASGEERGTDEGSLVGDSSAKSRGKAGKLGARRNRRGGQGDRSRSQG